MAGKKRIAKQTPAPAGNGQAGFERIPLVCIHASTTNPRRHFDERGMAELTESVRTHGVLQPILVRRRPKTANVYELVAGERRWRAAKAAGLVEIPAIVRDLKDEEVLEIQLVENLARADLHPMEEAAGYELLHKRHGYSVDSIAAKLGRSRKYVYDRIKLLCLVDEAQQAFREERITAGHAILLARLGEKDQKRALDPKEQAVFTVQHLLDLPYGEGDGRACDGAPERFKPRSVRELAGWIDQHIRLDHAALDETQLELEFPELAGSLAEAEESEAKVLPITYEHHVRPSARVPQRTWTRPSWKRADGRCQSKPCEHAVYGVVVAGPGRGDSFRVCVEKKKCRVHWAGEIREAARRAKLQGHGAGGKGGAAAKPAKDPWKERQGRENALRARWLTAAPKIVEAALAALARTAKPELAAAVVERELLGLSLRKEDFARSEKSLPKGELSAQGLLLRLAGAVVVGVLEEVFAFTDPDADELLRALGLDKKELLDEHAPVPKPEPKAQAPKPRKAPAKKKAPTRRKAAKRK